MQQKTDSLRTAFCMFFYTTVKYFPHKAIQHFCSLFVSFVYKALPFCVHAEIIGPTSE